MKTESRSLVLTSRDSDFTEYLYPKITLDPDAHHEVALIGLDMYHSIPNIQPSNNKFVYKYKGAEFTVVIPTGCYEIESINEYIQKEYNHKNIFEIRANANTLKCVIDIKDPDTEICFNRDNSLNEMLGFSKTVIRGIGEHESTNIVNILSVNSILVHCSIVEGSYLNNSQRPVLYSFFPNVPPGYKIVEKPHAPLYLPVTLPAVNTIRIWLTDQDDNVLNLRGEEVTIRIHLRSTYF